MPDHFAESLWYGSFFLVAAAGQLAFVALVLLRPTRGIVRTGVIASLLVIALWLVTRTIGVPVGPDQGETEPYGLLDAISSAAEACTALFGVLALRAWTGASAWRWGHWPPVLKGAAPMILIGDLLACWLGFSS
jgi:hypothetical protein